MIFRLFILYSAFASSSYEERLQRIQAMEGKANQLMEGMGFSMESQRIDASSKSRSRLIQRVNESSQLLPSGTLLFSKTMNRLVIGGEEAPAILRLNSSGKHQRFAGLKAIGNARASSTPGRVLIDVQKIILPSGSSIHLNGVALDRTGAHGLEAQVFSGKALMLAGSMVGSFLSGYASGNQTQTVGPFGNSQLQVSGRNSLLQGVAQTAADQSRNLIEEASKEKPVMVVEPGTAVTIYISDEVRL
jgi:hypothetical protein